MLKRAEIHREFSYLGGLASIQETVKGLLASFKESLIDEEEFALKMVLTELFNNAVLHGNKSDADLRVFGEVSLNCETGDLTISVSDEGEGFNWQSVLEDQRICPDKEQTLSENGRGFMLIRIYGYSYEFNEQGNSVALHKNLENLK